MTKRFLICASAWLALTAAHAVTTITVNNTADNGAGSLRWAIQQANLTGTADIMFAPTLKGKTIKVVSDALPPITKPSIGLHGDIDNDQRPDVTLDGSSLWSLPQGGSKHGLTVQSTSCLIRGLAIVGFPDNGILAMNASYLMVDFCHLGVDLAGNTRRPNKGYDLAVQNATGASIGHEKGGNQFGSNQGVGLWDCSTCAVTGNWFGLRADGLATFGKYDGTGVTLSAAQQGATGNYVNYNVFAGVKTGVELTQAGTLNNKLDHNTFGLAADGNTLLSGLSFGVIVAAGANNNTIGPANTFAGEGATGVDIGWAGTASNAVTGNAFGTNVSRSRQRALLRGVFIENAAGEQTVGGATAAQGNLLVPSATTGSPTGVELRNAGASSRVRHNIFGALPSGIATGKATTGVLIVGPKSVWVVDNDLAAPDTAVRVTGSIASAVILRNRFRECRYAAVRLTGGAYAYLGSLSLDLGPGNNRFLATNLWNIRNETPSPVPAEGNDFGTTSKPAIDKTIWDRLDDAALGLVDCIPLKGP